MCVQFCLEPPNLLVMSSDLRCKLFLLRTNQFEQRFTIERIQILPWCAIHGRSMPSLRWRCIRGKPASIQGNQHDHQTATSGAEVRSTLRQSMPSRSIDSWARLSRTTPLSAFGQMNRPRSRRLANRHKPSPSHQRSFTMSPLRPRNTNTCPENGCSCRTFCTCALSPSNPRRKSVTPAAIQILVSTGSWITCAEDLGSDATEQERLRSPR